MSNSAFPNRSFKIAIGLTLFYLGLGFAFLHFGLADYGWVFFILLPISLGIAIGAIPLRDWAYMGLATGIIIFIILLLVGGLEGMVCVLMALPIIIPLILLGVWINKYLIKKGFIKPDNNQNALLLPLLIVLFGAPFERYFYPDKVEIVEVKTERIYPFSCAQVYDAIKSVDTLVAEKSFLMRLDLPVPNKCILEKEAVGGLRTCYFSGGTITEKITELEKAKILRMDVIDYQLTGRKWLGFKEAIYYFDAVGKDSCKLTRVTSYSSVLKPRMYWEPLEKMGIEQEHAYVLESLNNDLMRIYNSPAGRDYELILPEKPATTVLILFPGFPENATDTKREFPIMQATHKQGVALLLMNFNRKLWLDEIEKQNLYTSIEEALKPDHLLDKNIYIGGFSSGGNMALSLSEYMAHSAKPLKTKGVFIVDSPIDLQGLIENAQNNIRRNVAEAAVSEGRMLVDLFEKNFEKDDKGNFKLQDYTLFDARTNDISKLSHLKDVKIRLYTEPDKNWWMQSRGCPYEETNAFYIKKLSEALQGQYGNRVELIETQNRGYRANSQRHPHSWSIVDQDQLISWILR